MKIFVTGATGFVGKRLILSLLEDGHDVYALCRIKGTQIFSGKRPNLHYIWGDLRNPATLELIPRDIELAYYLVHSMTDRVQNLEKMELEVAAQFVKGIEPTNVKQIIYLGGIINDENHLSPHLKSRLLVEKILKDSQIPVTILRASIIIGTGSASFEIIRDLCEKLPLMIAPKWVHTKCQPIAIRDAIFYLSSVLLNVECFGKTFDIGGPDVMTFKELLLEYASFRKLKRSIVDVPVLTPRLSSLWLVFITSVRFSLCCYLVESMRYQSIVLLRGIEGIIPHSCLTYRESLELAFQKTEQNDIVSTWMDPREIQGINPEISEYIKVPKEGCLRDTRKVPVQDSREAAIDRIWQIGGAKGWYAYHWAWRLRGFIDRMMGGVGLNRGRRHPENIMVGDPIDFWRVLLADRERGHLILFSEMKVPGEAWLEFCLRKEKGKWMLIQTATFRPRGIMGRLYWYSLIPFHHFIFQRMARALAR